MPGRRLLRSLPVALLAAALVGAVAALAGPAPPAAAASGPVAGSCVPPPAAHRGASNAAPEDTLPAFTAALRAGARILEMDVRFTADGEAVVLHDATVDRTTNGTGAVAAMRLASVRRLDAGRWFSRPFRGTRVPLLREVLRAGRPYGAEYLVELKVVPTTAQLRRFLGHINSSHVASRVTVTSFRPGALDAVRAAQPTLRRALIEAPADGPLDPVLAEGRLFLPNIGSVNPTNIARWQAAGLRIVPWLAGSERNWTRMASAGVSAVLTNRPAAYVRWSRRVCR